MLTDVDVGWVADGWVADSGREEPGSGTCTCWIGGMLCACGGSDAELDGELDGCDEKEGWRRSFAGKPAGWVGRGADCDVGEGDVVEGEVVEGGDVGGTAGLR